MSEGKTSEIKEGTVKVNGIDMYYREAGQGFPLLGIMGLGANADWWMDDIIEDLASQYRFIMPDNRGAGRTECPAEDWTIENNADDIAALMEALGIEKAHVMGFSMGGIIAQALAIKYPHKVEKLILACTTCGTAHGIPLSPELGESLGVLVTGNLSHEEAARKVAEILYAPYSLEVNPGLVEEFKNRYCIAPISRDGLVKQLKAIALFDSYHQLGQITAPTLIMAGLDDQMIPNGNADILFEEIPGSRLMKFAPAGHGFSTEVPEFTGIVLGFLK